MKKPTLLERIFQTQTNAFIAALGSGQYEEAISIRNRYRLVAEKAMPAIENAVQDACKNGQFEIAARIASGLNLQEIARRSYDRSLEQARFREAFRVGEHFGFLREETRPLRTLVSTAYRKAVSEFRFADAKECVCRELDVLGNPRQEAVLNLLLDAAMLVVTREPRRQWLPYVPGHLKFKCIPDTCQADCCRRTDYEIGVSQRDIELIKSRTGLPTKDFAIEEQGTSVLRMLAEPKGKRCLFLSADNRCGIHDFKPDSCVKYPFTVFPFGRSPNGDLDWFPDTRSHQYLSDVVKVREALAQLRDGSTDVHFFVLVGHEQSCPGFTEEPVSVDEYLLLMVQQLELFLCTDRSVQCKRHSPTPGSGSSFSVPEALKVSIFRARGEAKLAAKQFSAAVAEFDKAYNICVRLGTRQEQADYERSLGGVLRECCKSGLACGRLNETYEYRQQSFDKLSATLSTLANLLQGNMRPDLRAAFSEASEKLQTDLEELKFFLGSRRT